MTDRSCGLLGPLTLASRRTLWPIITQHAERLAGERLALMAEAAHVVPADRCAGAEHVAGAICGRCSIWLKHGRDGLGDAAMLEAYHRARIGDIRLRVQGIDLLNRASMVSARPLRDARALGLNALYALAPVRRMLMQMGLGVR